MWYDVPLSKVGWALAVNCIVVKHIFHMCCYKDQTTFLDNLGPAK